MKSLPLALLLLLVISDHAEGQCFLVPAQVCEGDCGPLFYLQNDPDGTTYQWSISCGTITNETSANPHTVCFTTPGICTIQVIIEVPGENPDTCSMQVEVLPNTFSDINEGVCEGDSVEVNGTYYTTGMYTDTIFGGSANGCDSILLITVSLIPVDTTEFLYNGCEGDSFSIVVNGNVYDENNPTGAELLTGSDGCDSLVNINLIFNPATSFDYIYFGCQGDSFSIVINSVIFNELNPTGVEVIPNSNGCDSVITVSLTFFPHVFDTITYSGCSGDGFSIVVGETEYNESNPTGMDTLPGGCDTLVFINLQFDTLTASLTLNGNQMCASPPGMQYIWMDCNNNILSDTTECVVVSDDGCICVIIDNGVCQDTVCEEFIVCELFCAIIAPDGICINDSFLLTAASNATDSSAFNWLITVDSNTTLQFNDTDSVWVTLNSTGCFSIGLEVIDSGCTTLCSDTICVVTKPLADLCCRQVACDTCVNLDVHLFGSPPWSIAISDGTTIDTVTGITSSQYDYTACPPANINTLYTLLWVQDSNGFCNGGIINDTASVHLESRPEATITVSGNTMCAEPSGFAYNWSNCANTQSFGNSQCFVPTASGCYCLTVSSLLPDCTDTACIEFVLVGTIETDQNQPVKIRYDPLHHFIVIEGNGRAIENMEVELMDIQGRSVPYLKKEVIGDEIMSITLQDQAPSLLIVSVYSDWFRYTKGIFVY